MFVPLGLEHFNVCNCSLFSVPTIEIFEEVIL